MGLVGENHREELQDPSLLPLLSWVKKGQKDMVEEAFGCLGDFMDHGLLLYFLVYELPSF